jgi:hypothetical protein
MLRVISWIVRFLKSEGRSTKSHERTQNRNDIFYKFLSAQIRVNPWLIPPLLQPDYAASQVSQP